MSINHYQIIAKAGSQEELEKESNIAARAKAAAADAQLEAMNYGSGTAYGRKQMVKTMKDPDTGERIRLPDLLASEIVFNGNRAKAGTFFKLFGDVVDQAIEMSTLLDHKGKALKPVARVKRDADGNAIKDADGNSIKESTVQPVAPHYAGAATSAREVAIAIGLKCVVDALHPHSNQSQEWVPGAALICRIADQLFLQLAHAKAYITDAKHLRTVEKYWEGANQAPKNRRTNQVRYQRKILTEDRYDELRTLFEAEGHHFNLAGHLVHLMAEVGHLLEPEWDKARQGEKNGLTRFKPSKGYVEGYQEITEHLLSVRMLPHPMIEKPLDWEPSKRGAANTTGGFHSDAYRQHNPMIRRRYGESDTSGSPTLCELLNKLQSTAYTVDMGMIDTFRFVMDNRIKASGVHHRPMFGVKELELMSERRKDFIKALPEGDKPNDEEQAKWSQAQSQRFKTAVKEEKKYLRSLSNSQVLDLLQEYGPEKKLWFPFSADHRTRVYPLTGGIQPQGTSAERRILRFAQGCRVDNETTMVEIHRAIGAAFKGTKISFDKREQWSRRNIGKVIADLDGTAQDIVTIKNWGADEVWDALAQAREYDAAVNGGARWHVPTGADATASGLQWISALRGDLRGLINSNVICDSDQIGPSWDPIDGYTKVTRVAQELLMSPVRAAQLVSEEWSEAHQYEPQVMAKMRDILDGGFARGLTKRVAMPQWYGCGVGTTKDNISDFLVNEMELEPMAMFPGEHGWKDGYKLIQGLSDYIRMALSLVYPSALETLSWLKSLSRKSIRNQLRKFPGQMPKLEWMMHDGQFVSYWENERIFRSIKVSGVGRLTTPIGVRNDVVDPNERAMRDAFAPNFVHSYDSALLRAVVRNWHGDHPINMIHDQIDVLPSDMPQLRLEIAKGFKEVIGSNPLSALPAMLHTPRSRPLPCQTDVLDNHQMSEYIFN